MTRNKNQAWVAGVSASVAEYYGVHVAIARLFFLLTFFMFGAGFVLYLWMWLSYPENTGQLRLG